MVVKMEKTLKWYVVNVVLPLALAMTFVTIGAHAAAPVLMPQNTTYQEGSGGMVSDTYPNAILHVAVIATGTNISTVVVDVSQVNTTGHLSMVQDGSVVIGTMTVPVYSTGVYVDKVVTPEGAKYLLVTATDTSGIPGTAELIIIIGAHASAPVLIPLNTTYQELSGGIASDTCPNAILHVAVIATGTNISTVVVDVSQVNTTGSLSMYRDGSVVIGNSTALVYSAGVYVDKTIRPGGAKSLPVIATDNTGNTGTTDLIIIAFTKMGVNVIGYDSSKAIPAHPANASFFYDRSPVKIVVTSIDGTQFTNVTASFASVDGSRSVEYDNSGVLLPDGNYSYELTHTLGIIPGSENVNQSWINVTFSVSTPSGNTIINIPQIGALAVLGNFNPKDDPSSGLGGDTTDWRTIPDYSAAYLVFEPVNSGATTSTSTEPTEQWNKTFGGPGLDYGYEVQQTTDGGYVIAGYSGSYPNRDALLIKTTASGNLQWNKNLGVAGYDDGAFSGQQTADGGYILAGWTDINDIYSPHRPDGRLIKTDASGNIIWSKTFGGASAEYFYSVRQTTDGGFIVVGKEGSTRPGDYSTYIVKTDVNGNEQWNKTTGGTGDGYWSVKQTSDGGYILAGAQQTYDVALLVKADASGNQQWSKIFGIPGKLDMFYSVQQTTDGGYVVAGSTQSYGNGSYDAWLVKTDASGNEDWSKTFGGANYDCAHSVQQTIDGGYILAGWKDATTYGTGNAEAWLIKTDAIGIQQWTKTFGGTNYDEALSVQQTTDGGYIVCGDTYSFGTGPNNVWLVKFSRDTPVPPTGKIATLQFNEPIDLTNYETAMQLKNLGQMLVISGKSMDLNASANALSAFNKAATLTIYNLTAFTIDPGILQNGILTPTSGSVITNYNWNNSTKTLAFSVAHWTAYSWDGTLPSLYPLAVDYPAGQTAVKSGQSVKLNAEVYDLYSGVLNVTADATNIGAGVVIFSTATDNIWSNTAVVNAADGNYLLTVTAYDKAANRNTGSITVSVDNNATPAEIPVANFIGTPTSGTAPLTVTFTDTSTNTPTSWIWDFGDGSYSTEKNPSYIYLVNGTYTVSLTATNAAGSNTKTVDNYITVNAASGADNVGVFRGGVFYRNGADAIVYGLSTDTPVIGDWNGDHISEVGVFRGGVFYRNGADAIVYGLSTDTPVIGDWNGDGMSEVGVFRGGVFYRNGADAIVYGLSTDTPVIGDWNGDGMSEVGVFRDGVFYRNGATYIVYGLSTDTPVIGKWT